MNRTIIAASAVLTAAAISTSCASLGDSFLLAFDVDGSYQSEAVTAEGVDAYQDRLMTQGDVSASADVQRYFEAALRFDPANAEAARYLALVEDYRAGKYSASVKKADSLLKKPTRTADEEYAMLVAVRRAADIYPRDDDTARLLRATADNRKAYVSARLSEAEAIRAAIKPESKESVKEREYIQAFNLVVKARDVEPRDVAGAKAYRELRSDIAIIVRNRLGGVDGLSAKGSFEEARTVLALVKELDSKIGRAFAADIAKSEYGLYLSWARYHESRKEWSKADARVKAALAIDKGSDAIALQKRIGAAADAEERGATFEAGLKNLDAYIAKGSLVRAQRLLASLSKSATGPQRSALDTRRRKMLDSLADVYAGGVSAYRAERFGDAVASFETVVAVESSYEDAAEYLEKARAKQKLLDQY